MTPRGVILSNGAGNNSNSNYAQHPVESHDCVLWPGGPVFLQLLGVTAQLGSITGFTVKGVVRFKIRSLRLPDQMYDILGFHHNRSHGINETIYSSYGKLPSIK